MAPDVVTVRLGPPVSEYAERLNELEVATAMWAEAEFFAGTPWTDDSVGMGLLVATHQKMALAARIVGTNPAVTCRHCGRWLTVEDDTWIDDNGDDGCEVSGDVHAS